MIIDMCQSPIPNLKNGSTNWLSKNAIIIPVNISMNV